LDKAIAEAESLQRTPKITEAKIKKGLKSIKQKYKMTSLELVIDSDSGSKEKVHVEGEINPKKPGQQIEVSKMKGLTVAEAVAEIAGNLKAKKTNFEIRVHTEEDARAVIAQAFPTATEHTPPSVESAYSDKDAKAIKEHRDARKEQLGFHVDTKPYNAAEVEKQLRQEIAKLERDIPLMKGFAADPVPLVGAHTSEKEKEKIYQEAARKHGELASQLHILKQRLADRKAVLSDLAIKKKEWEKLEKEKVLYGHATSNLEKSPHRTNPHINVEGALPKAQIAKADDEVIIKVAIYIKPKK